MADLDRLCQLLPLDRLQSLNEELRLATNGKKPKTVFDAFVDELNKRLKVEEAEDKQKTNAANAENASGGETGCIWTVEEQQLLVKAMTVFPVGTKSRWDVVAAFINEHRKNEDGGGGAKLKTGKDVVKKVKELERLGKLEERF